MRLPLHQFPTLDGIYRAPGGSQAPSRASSACATVAGGFGRASASLLGRKAYENFSSSWPAVTDPAGPIASKLNSLPKYVALTR